jgi:HAD superfamily hydrolase (TIGR01509 family)
LQAIVFDFEGVIIDSERIRFTTYQQLFKEEFSVDIGEFDPLVLGRKQEDNLQMFLDKFSLQGDIPSLVSKRRELLVKVFSKPENVQVVPGLKEFLDKVKGQYVLAIGSSSTADHINRVLDYLNLQSYFSVKVTADDLVKGKPHPEVYLKVATQLGLSPDKCVVIEDSPHGVLAAHAAGMKCVGLQTSIKGIPADVVVSDFRDLLDLKLLP